MALRSGNFYFKIDLETVTIVGIVMGPARVDNLVLTKS